MEVEILFIVKKTPFDCAQGAKNKKIATDSRKKLLKILTRAQRTDAVNKFRIKKSANLL
jgi:hypothetical protein